MAQLTLHLPWVWALHPRSEVPFIRVLHQGFELRIQHWPHQPYNNTRWDMLDGAVSTRAFGYCDSIEDAEHFVMAMAVIYRDRLPNGPELTELLELPPAPKPKEKPIKRE